jgi:hypothetical protein
MSTLREYVVTLHRYEDLEEFYDDMETEGGNLYIPDRAVELAARRPISRNTHYMLSDDEAALLRTDSRVEAVSLTVKELGIKVVPCAIQTSNFWDKSFAIESTHRNWGLLRCTEGVNRSGWGSNGTQAQSGTVRLTSKGKNVDVVIVDGHIDKNHPEFARNADGTGGSRIVEYNWFQHTSQVTGGANGVYNYTFDPTGPDASDHNHGAHVAGTVAGNTQGWARDANIYFLNPYGSSPSPISTQFIFDYIRVWHNSKPINPATGYRNPTILNCSFAYVYATLVSEISQLYYRGVLVKTNPTGADLSSYGIYNNGTQWRTDVRVASVDADCVDAINEGIIIVAAAGNQSGTADISTGPDFNNYFVWTSSGGGAPVSVMYGQGTSPAAAPGVISVGAVDLTTTDRKVDFSNRGPRVDVFAPGTFIISSVNSGGVADARGSGLINKYSGTSMASPQVTGVLASLLETYPRWKQADARAYIANVSKAFQVEDTGGPMSDWYALRDSNNRYLFYRQERPASGSAWPKVNYNTRPTSGVAYPRFTRKI